MVETSLNGRRILVVEDEYFLADDLCSDLVAAGAEIVGPASCIEAATAEIAAAARIDAAILDVNLGGEMIFPVADILVARGIPFAFATGYDRWSLPERFKAAPRLEKPLSPSKTLPVVRQLLAIG